MILRRLGKGSRAKARHNGPGLEEFLEKVLALGGLSRAQEINHRPIFTED